MCICFVVLSVHLLSKRENSLARSSIKFIAHALNVIAGDESEEKCAHKIIVFGGDT